MKGLNVEATPQERTTPAALPDMVAVPGTETSVRISPRMKTTPGWIQNFSTLLPQITNCLMKAANGIAYVTHIGRDPKNSLRIDISDLNGNNFHCLMDKNGGVTLVTAQDEVPLNSSPLFFPRLAGAPVLKDPDCYETEPVVARPDGLIGWLAFPSASCSTPLR